MGFKHVSVSWKNNDANTKWFCDISERVDELVCNEVTETVYYAYLDSDMHLFIQVDKRIMFCY